MIRRVLVLMILRIPQITLGQDPGFSQFFANPLHLNPAFNGTSELPRFVLNYRNQWPQKGTTYTTYSASYDQIVKKLNTGFGIYMYQDRELNNIINTNSASFPYSYYSKFDYNRFMTLGLQGGIIFPSEINQLTG